MEPDGVGFPVRTWQDGTGRYRRPRRSASGPARPGASGLQGEAMPQQKRGLGKGLGALIPTAPTVAAEPGHSYPSAVGAEADPGPLGAYFEEIPIGAVTPNPRQPRQVFDEEALEELAASIRVVGLL